MSLPNYFASLGRYHVWATNKLLASNLKNLSDADWRRDCGLFFRSVHGTLNHLLVADELWYARFAEGRSPCQRRRRAERNVLIRIRCTYASRSSAARTLPHFSRQRSKAVWTTSSASGWLQPRSTAERTSVGQRAATYSLKSSIRTAPHL